MTLQYLPQNSLISTLVLGFSVGALARLAVHRADVYLAGMAELFMLFGGRAFAHDAAYVANDGQAVSQCLCTRDSTSKSWAKFSTAIHLSCGLCIEPEGI